MAEIVAYKLALELLGAAGDALVKLTDGFKHMITTGAAGYSHIAARNTHKRLVKLSADSTDLQANWQAPVVRSIDEYLREKHPTCDDWTVVRGSIAFAIEQMKEILDDVRKERSDFVLEDAYSKLSESLPVRLALLGKVRDLPPPQSEGEKESLRQISAEYKRLLSEFRKAIKQLNRYLKKGKQVLEQ